MSENNISWFHCGRCGSLFESTMGDIDDRLCGECGRSPSLGFDAIPAELPAAVREPASSSGETSGTGGERARHSQRKRKKNHLMLKLLVGWSVVLAVIIVGSRWLFEQNLGTRRAPAIEKPVQTLGDEEIALLNEASEPCNMAFSGFLTAGTPEVRNQFVLSPISTASRMARFYSLNPIPDIDPATLKLTQSAVLYLPGARGVETVWNATDGRRFGAVFMQEGGEWRLDWDHFVRYGDYPWALFLAGSGEPEGEFRLLARERLAEERKDADTISIVLYAPRFGSANETGFQSPEFLVKRTSENGKLLDAAFKLEKKGERVYGVKISSPNPENLIRVRVKVKRIEENMERRFELEKVVACHWYSTDDPGVKPAPQADGK